MFGGALLIGHQNQPNLGLGYLSAVLRADGVDVRVLDVQDGVDAIRAAVREAGPSVVGLSVIFQYDAGRLREVAEALRRDGYAGHITAGGHYPSLADEAFLDSAPAIDSVIRFEGEETLRELVRRLGNGQGWQAIEGITYRGPDGRVVANPARPLIADLDTLPPPDRPGPLHRILGKPTVPLLASRGCARGCSFCSIHAFYGSAPGAPVRRRRPEAVVAEMRTLFDERGARIFLFQDDDFPVYGPAGARWGRAFAQALSRAHLPGRAIWKISCRVDEVEADRFAALREAGLYLVYLGIESGTEVGLDILAKRLDPGVALRATSILAELGLAWQYGFMLFDPSSTLDLVGDNLAYLRRLVADGGRAVTFCRMLPYEGTPIRRRLADEGRLRGSLAAPDYTFLDPGVDRLYGRVVRLVDPWLGNGKLCTEVDWAWQEVHVLRRLFPPLDGLDGYADRLRSITRAANDGVLEIVERELDAVRRGVPSSASGEGTGAEAARIGADLRAERDAFILRHQPVLLRHLGEPAIATGA